LKLFSRGNRFQLRLQIFPTNDAGADGVDIAENTSVLTFTEPIDQLIITTDKANGANSNVTLGFATFTGDFISSPATSIDTDGDSIPDHVDLDSDNDGISDLEESGQDPSAVDLNNDGIVDGGIDANGVPQAANGGVTPVDSDNDGFADFLDLDSDDDGIPDTVEARPTAGFTTNDGDVTDDDTDGIATERLTSLISTATMMAWGTPPRPGSPSQDQTITAMASTTASTLRLPILMAM